MGFAEQKAELLRIVASADEETTSRLIDFVHQITSVPNFSAEDLAEFDRRHNEYLKNPDSGISLEEALNRIRKRLQK